MRNGRMAKSALPPRQHQQEEKKYRKHQRWLLLLCHATNCTASKGGQCKLPRCSKAQKLWAHIVECNTHECAYGLCIASRILVSHHQHCRDERCPLCLPVRRVIMQQQRVLLSRSSDSSSSVVLSTCQASSRVRSSHVNHDEGPSRKRRKITEAETLVANKNRIKGGSLTEIFTLQQLEEHICSLRKWGEEVCKNQGKHYVDNTQVQRQLTCELCRLSNLTFQPPLIACIYCGYSKHLDTYYATDIEGHTYKFCTDCFKDYFNNTHIVLVVDGLPPIHKDNLQLRYNDPVKEKWIQCYTCNGMIHQICALYDSRMKGDKEEKFKCPICLKKDMERMKENLSSWNIIHKVENLQSTHLCDHIEKIPTVKNIPSTRLSDHIEKRISRRLEEDRKQRAQKQSKSYDEVPSVQGIFVRVVSSVKKEVQVKQQFLDIFKKKSFPKTFPYRSKVVLLFQNIEGVDVCILAFYVQEFGSKCPFPNERYVYFSYLDSVEYFRPKEPAANETSLRRFVYHELLIGYMEYCKMKGFATCYIWVSAPANGDDYIFYCHPPTQKTLNNSLLIKWYKDMVEKAINEKIVLKSTNIHTQFWGKSSSTAARLPYCEGNFLPEKMEESIAKLEEENWHCRQGTCLTVARKDYHIMKKLEPFIEGTKRHHMLIHLHPRCSHCFRALASDKYWVCKICMRDFQLCNECYDEDKRLESSERHAAGMHKFDHVEVKNVHGDTDEEENEIRSPFFDNREDFQNLCQGNYYQFDTLRHAKFSSMMILFHICNPHKHAFIAVCNKCHTKIEVGEVGWRCESCKDYDECDACHHNENLPKHPHPLTPQTP